MASTCADNIATAIHLAASGFSVFPCHSGGSKAKQPMPFIKWREASTTDLGQINGWWRKWPDAAVGLDLAKSNLIVIDADRHDQDDGVHALGELMASIGYEPHGVPLAATPNEGTHFFYRQPEGKALGNGRGTLPPGIDVRGHGGYVIAPGTVMQDGRLYEVFGDIADAPELPAWLLQMLEAGKGGDEDPRPARAAAQFKPDTQHQDARIAAYCDTAIREEISLVASCGKGGRNNTLNQAAFALGQLVGANWVDETTISSLLETAAHDCGLVKDDGTAAVRKTIRSGISAGRQQPRVLPENADDLPAYDTRKLLEAADGTIHDAETGEVVVPFAASTNADKTPAYPPGLVGHLAKWIAETARRPQPELAIGAALAIVGTVAGRQFAGPTMSGTHLYVLGLAPTGKGKDHPLQAIGRIMAAAGMSSHLGPSEFISMPAVVNFLVRKPLSICAMDEFGGFMKRINSKRASGFEGAISKVIRTMWSSSFAPYFTPEWAQKASETIFAPAMTLFGASTPEQFYASMEGAALEDGTLNRFLLLNGRDKVKERDPIVDPAKVPVELVDGLKGIYNRSGPLAIAYRNDPHTDPASHGAVRVIHWCADGSLDRYRAFGEEVEKVIDSDPDQAPFFARTVEMALRIATIIAIGRIDDDQLRIADLDFGISLAMDSSTSMAAGAADYMADNENQANAQKVVRCIRSKGGRIVYRQLLRSLQNSIKARDLKELLQSMHDAGQIERQEVKAPSGPPSFWYQVLE